MPRYLVANKIPKKILAFTISYFICSEPILVKIIQVTLKCDNNKEVQSFELFL